MQGGEGSAPESLLLRAFLRLIRGRRCEALFLSIHSFWALTYTHTFRMFTGCTLLILPLKSFLPNRFLGPALYTFPPLFTSPIAPPPAFPPTLPPPPRRLLAPHSPILVACDLPPCSPPESPMPDPPPSSPSSPSLIPLYTSPDQHWWPFSNQAWCRGSRCLPWQPPKD